MINLNGYISYPPSKVNGKLFHLGYFSHAPLISTTTNLSIIKRTLMKDWSPLTSSSIGDELILAKAV